MGRHNSRNAFGRKVLCRPDSLESDSALHPDDDGPRRSGFRSDMRRWDDGVRGGAVGAALDHNRYEPSATGAVAATIAYGDVSLLRVARRESGRERRIQIRAASE